MLIPDDIVDVWTKHASPTLLTARCEKAALDQSENKDRADPRFQSNKSGAIRDVKLSICGCPACSDFLS